MVVRVGLKISATPRWITNEKFAFFSLNPNAAGALD